MAGSSASMVPCVSDCQVDEHRTDCFGKLTSATICWALLDAKAALEQRLTSNSVSAGDDQTAIDIH